ncbi:hypothetical protein ES705_42232 [subsurface metagenome]
MLVEGSVGGKGDAGGAEEVEVEKGSILGMMVDDLDAGMPDGDKVDKGQDLGYGHFGGCNVGAFDGEDQMADGIDGQVLGENLGGHGVGVDDGGADEFGHCRSSVKAF